MNAVQDAHFNSPTDPFKLPDWAQSNQAADTHLGPTGPVAADDLISPSGACAPKAEAAAPPPPAPKPVQASAPSGGLQPEGLSPGAPAMAAPMVGGGVTLGMSECAVARRLGTPSNVSISAGPHGQRRVVLTYLQSDRPGLYSFESGRLKEIDATPQQANKYDKGAKRQSRRARTRGSEHMYVQ